MSVPDLARFAVADPPSEERRRLKGSPEFAQLVVANAYLDWVTGAAPSFAYFEGQD